MGVILMIGIYKITNQVNGKVYIGQSVHIKQRWNQHRSAAFNPNDKEYNKYFYYSIRKYGLKNFTFEVIEECKQEELNEKEIYWIKYYDSTNKEKGYNVLSGGNQGGFIYDYNEIFEGWKKGYTCKELQKIFNCGDQVITAALRANNIFEYDAKSRASNKNKFVALSKDGKPLKIFEGMKNVSQYFTDYETKADNLTHCIIPNHYSLFGYYWDYLKDDNIPENELTDEEFLSYQMPNLHYSEEEKEKKSKQQRTVERPSRKELKQLIRTKPFTQIGKMYGVSDNAIRKWCDFEKLPRKKNEINKYTDEEWELI